MICRCSIILFFQPCLCIFMSVFYQYQLNCTRDLSIPEMSAWHCVPVYACVSSCSPAASRCQGYLVTLNSVRLFSFQCPRLTFFLQTYRLFASFASEFPFSILFIFQTKLCLFTEELQNMGRNCKLVNGQLIIPNSLHSRQLDIEKKCPKPEWANL